MDQARPDGSICPGAPLELRRAMHRAFNGGHELWGASQEGAPPVVLCQQCGGWTQCNQSPLLAGECRMHPTEAAAECIRRFRRGIHPVGNTMSANFGVRITKAYLLEPEDFVMDPDV